jgi:replication factor C small subunit
MQSNLSQFIWYEKHRPSMLDEMTLPVQYRRAFEGYLKEGNLPHLLFHGPQGSGKTTLAFVLMNNIDCVRMILNASSSDRGVETMRGKVKQFASSRTVDGSLKIVFFDESDGLTPQAQEALRNTIETYAQTCRFIFTCNEIDRIIGPLQSRFTIFEFSAFPLDQVIQQAEKILVKERIEYDIESVKKIVNQHYPDVRAIINNLQLCSSGGDLNPETVSKTTVDPALLLDCIANGEVAKIRKMLVGMSNFVFVYRYLFDTLLMCDDLTQEQKIEITHALAEGLYRDALVANREINFIDCVINIMGIIKCPTISFLG